MPSFVIQVGSLLVAALQVTAVSFPSPTGPYNTSLTTAKLVDNHRLDPFAPTKKPRALMVSVFNPISASSCFPITTPYAPGKTAEFEDAQYAPYGIPPGTFESLHLQTCSARSRSLKTFPLVLFSPGAGNTRLFYSVMAQKVASAGYTVVTIDHPYDVDIVTFPDNTIVLGLDFTDEQIPFATDVRAKDISFVIDQLSIPAVAKKLIPGLSCGLDVAKVGIFGHSLGGAAAAQAMLSDHRLVGGINLDGTFFSTVVGKGLKKPFLIFAHEGKNISSDPSWGSIWPKLTGWKRMFQLEGSAHGTFTDLPDVVEVLGFGGKLGDGASELLGAINGTRAMAVITTYVESFMDLILKGKNNRILDGPAKEYPEVSLEAA